MLNNTLCPKSNFNNSFHEAQTAHNQGQQAHQSQGPVELSHFRPRAKNQ